MMGFSTAEVKLYSQMLADREFLIRARQGLERYRAEVLRRHERSVEFVELGMLCQGLGDQVDRLRDELRFVCVVDETGKVTAAARAAGIGKEPIVIQLGHISQDPVG